MKVWSQSKKRWLDTEEMHTSHLQNLKAKVLRGEYRDDKGEPLSADEELELLQSLDGEIAKRAEAEGATVEE